MRLPAPRTQLAIWPLGRALALISLPPACPPAVLLWDDQRRRAVAELEFRTPVLGLAFRHARLLVVLRDHVCVYSFPGIGGPSEPPRLLYRLETADNPRGQSPRRTPTLRPLMRCAAASASGTPSTPQPRISPRTASAITAVVPLPMRGPQAAGRGILFASARQPPLTQPPLSPFVPCRAVAAGCLAVSTNRGEAVVAIPGRQAGHVHVIDVLPSGAGGLPRDQARHGAVIMIPAHRHAIAGLAVSRSGRLVASVSETGTIVRVFDAQTRACLHEFRRGLTAADVHCLRFAGDSGHLCATSDKSIHVFALRDPSKNPRPAFGAVMDLVTGTEAPSRAFATLPTSAPGVCAFGPDGSSVIGVCTDATWHKFPLASLSASSGAHRSGEAKGGGKEFARLIKADASAMFRI